jgi:hypothetical protein
VLRSDQAICCSKCHTWFLGCPAAKRRIRARGTGPIGLYVYSIIDLDFCSRECWQSSYIAGSIQLESMYAGSAASDDANAPVLQDRMSLPELIAAGDPESKRIHVLYKFRSDLSTSIYQVYLYPPQFTLDGFKAALVRGTLQPPPLESETATLVVANLDTWHPYTPTSFAAACQNQSELLVGLDWKQ